MCFHLVVPALNGRLRHWLSDVDDALSAADRRAVDAVAVLASHGLTVSAEVGDSMPLLAIEDVLSQFAADEIVISTLAPSGHTGLSRVWSIAPVIASRLPISHVIAEEAISPSQSEAAAAGGRAAHRATSAGDPGGGQPGRVPARSQSSAAGLPPTAARVRSRRG